MKIKIIKPIKVNELNSLEEAPRGNILLAIRSPIGDIFFLPGFVCSEGYFYSFSSYFGVNQESKKDLLGWIPVPVYKQE